MSSPRESLPIAWTASDEGFFRIVADVFAADFLWGAGTLLASYDGDTLDTRDTPDTRDTLGDAAPVPAATTPAPARTEPVADWPHAA